MKKILSVIILMVSIFGFIPASSSLAADNNPAYYGGGPVTVLVIDQGDTVFFDISQVVVNGTTAEFPIFVRSNDVINSLDFSFKYNHSELLYDTIINLAWYIEPLSFYNSNDSTVRLTSYSITQPYANNVPLFKVRFTVISGQLCSTDLDSINALLNGDACSAIAIECAFIGMDEINNENILNVFPNPANSILNLETNEQGLVEINDMEGRHVMSKQLDNFSNSKSIDISSLDAGVYFLSFYHKHGVSLKKIVISE